MKIKPKTLEGQDLAISKQYEVLAICKSLSDNISYGLIVDDKNQPILANLENFQILSSEIPSDWKTTVSSIYLSISPNNSFNADFWDDYFDDINEAKEMLMKKVTELKIKLCDAK
jgi:hypothetical protein